MRFNGLSEEFYGRGNRLIVDEFNTVKGTKNIYAVGDTAFMDSDKNFPNGHPQVAQVAMQQGKNLAKNLLYLQSIRLINRLPIPTRLRKSWLP